jgi:predicted RNA polymerase sigma factor
MTKSIDGRFVSRFHLESAIAWEHCRAPSFHQTDWNRVVDLYRQLATMVSGPTIVVSLAFAESQAYGVEAGIERLKEFPETASESELAQRDTLQACLDERRGEHEAATKWFELALRRDISPSHRVAIEQLRQRQPR